MFSVAHKSEARRAKAWLKDRIEKSKKLPHGELICEAVEITPAMAEILLADHNRGNRPFKTKRFQYAEDMKSGNWLFHAQGLSLSKDGFLNNGQNRLAAIILAGCAIRMMVAFGEDREVFSVIDTGSPRGGADSLHIKGKKNTTVLAAAARLVRILGGGAPTGYASFPNQKILQTIDEHPRLEDWTTDGTRICKKLRGATAAGPTVAFYMISEQSKHARRLETFATLLAEGNIPTKRDPILTLREALKDRRIPPVKSGIGATYVCASIIKAWNLWVRGRTANLANISWSAGEPFPIPE